MKTALEQAKALYGHPYGLRRDVTRAMEHGGHVIISPSLVLIGYQVPAGLPCYPRPWAGYPGEVCDAWLVWLAAGDLGEFLRRAPYPLPWLVWARRGRVRQWRWEDVRNKIDASTHHDMLMR